MPDYTPRTTFLPSISHVDSVYQTQCNGWWCDACRLSPVRKDENVKTVKPDDEDQTVGSNKKTVSWANIVKGKKVD